MLGTRRVAITLALLATGCSRPDAALTADVNASAPLLASAASSATPAPPPRSKANWSHLRSFACQLQNLNVDQAAASNFDLLIIDYSSAGDAASRYTPDQVAKLQAGGRRKVLAYLSVGEAESYRFYWQKSYKPGQPAWLGRPNSKWAENYNVAYWHPQWQSITESYLDQILEGGYDGVFMDVVDAYERYPKRPQARREMAKLVMHLGGYARQRAGADFGVVLNGGEGLVYEPGLTQSITGVAKEEIFVGLDGDNKVTPANFTRRTQAALQPLVKARKLVLSIDYATRPEKVSQAHKRAAAAGYLEYVGVRGLDRLVAQPR